MGKTVASQLNVVLVADTGEWSMGMDKATASTRKFEAAAQAAARSQAIDQISNLPARTPNVTEGNSIFAQQEKTDKQRIEAQKEIARAHAEQEQQNARSAQIAREASASWTQRELAQEAAIAEKKIETAAKIAAINAKVSATSSGSRFDNANPFAQQVMATAKLNALLAQRKTLTDEVARAQSRLAITEQVAEVRSIRANLTADSSINRLRNLGSTVGDNQGKYARFGVVMQQAGYQMQDFAVQVAGGQNKLVAFSQQGAQLLGVFGVGGAIAGAVLSTGVLIARMAGLDTGMKEQKTTVDELAQSFRDLAIAKNESASDKFAELDFKRAKQNYEEQAAIVKKLEEQRAKLLELSKKQAISSESDVLGAGAIEERLNDKIKAAYETLDILQEKLNKSEIKPVEVALKKEREDKEKVKQANDLRNTEAQAAYDRTQAYNAQIEANADLYRTDKERLAIMDKQIQSMADMGEVGTLAFAQLQGKADSLAKTISEKGIATLNGLQSRIPQSLSLRAGGQSTGGFVGAQNTAQTTVKLLQDMLSTLNRIAVGVN